jgi:TRAP-type C4-dicarboxylate transport system permease small subunit
MMSLMTLFIFAQVIFRYALKLPLSWSEELSRYLFTGITLFGAVLLYRTNTHINMTLLKDAIKIKALQSALDIAAQVLTLIFLLIVIRYGFPLSIRMLNLGGISPSMPWFKIGYVYIALPIAALFSVLGVLEVITSIIIKGFNFSKPAEADKAVS